jgi:hypothetical protein
MASDTPALYLAKVVKLLTGRRGMGRAERVREGYAPYSYDLDFRGADEATALGKIAWARDQAPYAQIELVPDSAATGMLTIFAGVDVQKLALYLAERSLMQETGQTWETATGQLPLLVKQAIAGTVGDGKDWPALLADLQRQSGTLEAIRHALETGEFLKQS